MKGSKVAETHTVDKLVRMGYDVSKPVHYDCPYDLIADINGHLQKVQVKCCHRSKERTNSLRCDLRRRSHRSNGMREDTYSRDEVDVFAVYWPDEDELLWIPFEDAPKERMVISIEKKKSGKSPKRLLENRKIENVL
jgi:hypothetical protein